jgi:thiamine pyrophosphate-dependent acetolactate synthase large subunit-like protein
MNDINPKISAFSHIEQPEALSPEGPALFGSDAIAETLRSLDIPYMALNPGASYRGLHDSLVNHLGNVRPQMLLCLHEEHAVAIAHGWAKVTGKPMLVGVHSNVGLFHATMAIFNAWCDRMPVIVLGATGPVDAAKRRPWIEWIHTAQDQGAIVRPYVKWDAQPASPEAAREALLRGAWLAKTAPQGPVYINLDAGLQEEPLAEPLVEVDSERLMPRVTATVSESLIGEVTDLLKQAKRPIFLMGRVGRSEDGWRQRVALAEAFNARVVTDLKVGATFPTDHPLHIGSPGVFPLPEAMEALAEADVIVSLDWVDLAGTLRIACKGAPAGKVVQVSLDHVLHNGWSADHQGLPPVDLFLAAEPDRVVAKMAAKLHKAGPAAHKVAPGTRPEAPSVTGPIAVPAMAKVLRQVVGDRAVSLLHLPLSWDGASWPFRHPLDFLGSDGGGGIGGGPGIAVGSALALRDSGRLPIAICGDGDFLMGATALWTATHYRIPAMFVIANNQSFFNDEVHQERMAQIRNRPIENKWIGMRMTDPEIDLASIARAQGAVGIGPVMSMDQLEAAFEQAIAAVDSGGVAVVDVRVITGYTPAMASALMKAKS